MLSGNTLGSNGPCAGGLDANAYSFNLSPTQEGSLVYGAAAMRGATHTPGAGFLERVQIHIGTGGDIAGAAAQDRTVLPGESVVTVNGAFSSAVDWAVIAVEVKP